MSHSDLDIVQETLRKEADAIQRLAETLVSTTVSAVIDQIMNCQGRLVVSGMGKMGQIGRKASATFCSTGTPSIFLHPGEAVHGDLGMVIPGDVWLALSNSGETDEVNSLLPFMHRYDIPVISITGNSQSSLARRSRHVLDIGVAEEVETLTNAPTTSTTLALALCDALAVTLMKHRGFTAEQFAIFHPSGNLGRKLLLTVAQLMHSGERIPASRPSDTVVDGIMTISQKGLGATVLVDDANQVIGIFTDGDLRRTLEKNQLPTDQRLADVMTREPLTIRSDALAAEALKVMEEKEITVLPVVDDQGKLDGVIHLHDLVRVGLA